MVRIAWSCLSNIICKSVEETRSDRNALGFFATGSESEGTFSNRKQVAFVVANFTGAVENTGTAGSFDARRGYRASRTLAGKCGGQGQRDRLAHPARIGAVGASFRKHDIQQRTQHAAVNDATQIQVLGFQVQCDDSLVFFPGNLPVSQQVMKTGQIPATGNGEILSCLVHYTFIP